MGCFGRDFTTTKVKHSLRAILRAIQVTRKCGCKDMFVMFKDAKELLFTEI